MLITANPPLGRATPADRRRWYLQHIRKQIKRTYESIEITGRRQFHDDVFPRAGLCPRCHRGTGIWCRYGDGRLFVAFKLPNLLRRIFAEGAFSQAFVPILAEYKSQQGEEATRTLVAYVSGLLTLILAVVTVAGMLAAPWVIFISAPGFTDTPDKFALTSALLRVTFPYILLISLASLVGAILNTWNRFSIPAFAPTLLNVSMIGFALLLRLISTAGDGIGLGCGGGGSVTIRLSTPAPKKNRHVGITSAVAT